MRSPIKIISKFFAIFLFSLITISSFSFLPLDIKTVYSQTEPKTYTPLAPLPGTRDGNATDSKADLKTYLPGIFKIIIGLAAVLAVGRIIWGGILYITTDAWHTKSEGKEMIKKAILGLIFITASWVIFYTINPNLFNDPKYPCPAGSADGKCLTIVLTIGSDTITGGLPSGGYYDPATLASANAALAKVASTCPGCSLSNVPLNLNTADVARLSCTNCGPLNTAIRLGGNAQRNVDPSLNTKLVALNNATMNNTTMTITEGYPPTRHHAADCHFNGTCVDATILSTAPNSIASFISNAKTTGLTPIYEVADEATRRALITGTRINGVQVGVPCANIIALPPINGRNQITGSHFSVYSNPPAHFGTCP